MDFTNPDSPAFPRSGSDGYDPERGLKAREWFAGQALAGLLANRDFCLFAHDGAEMSAELAARNAFALADAMLAESRRKHDEAQAERKRRIEAGENPWMCYLCGHEATRADFVSPAGPDACPKCGGSNCGDEF